MTKELLTVDPADTIGETAQKMVEIGVSSAVVSDYGRLIGIVTERDLTRAVAGRVHSSEARVREWMTADPKVVSESTDPVEAVQIMLDGGRSEEHTSELQSRENLVCRLLLEKKKKII